VICDDFETWTPHEAGFHAVVSFTAFHWISPEVRYAKTAALLRPDGRLAIVSTKHVLDDSGDDFFTDVQDDYDSIVPGNPHVQARRPRHPDAIEGPEQEIEASGLFRVLFAGRYQWDVEYRADEYIDLLNTSAGHRALHHSERAALAAAIRARILRRPGGTVRRTHLSTLTVAKPIVK
jgi:hypothetical protein